MKKVGAMTQIRLASTPGRKFICFYSNADDDFFSPIAVAQSHILSWLAINKRTGTKEMKERGMDSTNWGHQVQGMRRGSV